MKINRPLENKSLYVSLFAFCLICLSFSFPAASGLTQNVPVEPAESPSASAERATPAFARSVFKSVFDDALATPGGAVISAGELIISEFRWRGQNGANDEFIEIYNNTDAAITVAASDASAGYALRASDGVTRLIIPNGTVIPGRGHYLGCNSVGYSLASYPAGNGTTATCDATYTLDIPDNTGIALFRTANAANATLSNRLDAVGASAEANALYKEGTGVRNLNAFPLNYSYYRRPSGGCLGTIAGSSDANCTTFSSIFTTLAPTNSNAPDTDNNRNDFFFTDTNGTQASSEGTQQRLAAPGPENLSSPIAFNSAQITNSRVDTGVSDNQVPNLSRDFTSNPGNNATFGTINIRRKFTNNTGVALTRLRFRVVDITTFPAATFSLPDPPNNFCGAPGSQCAADLRPDTSTATIVSISAAGGGGTATVQGTTLEEAAAPADQPNGGGYNSSLSAGTVTLATPLAPGASINVQFRLGVQQRGAFRFAVVTEGLPTGGGIFSISCSADVVGSPCQVNNNLVVTAASASIAGRVTTGEGRGVRGTIITLTDTEGNTRATQTNTFGYYRFANVPAGATYIVSARGKRIEAVGSSQTLNITEDTTDVDFIVSP